LAAALSTAAVPTTSTTATLVLVVLGLVGRRGSQQAHLLSQLTHLHQRCTNISVPPRHASTVSGPLPARLRLEILLALCFELGAQHPHLLLEAADVLSSRFIW